MEIEKAASLFLSQLLLIDVDVSTRCYCMRRKAERLEKCLKYVHDLHRKHLEATTKKQIQQVVVAQETQKVQDSIQNAIERARKIREEMKKKDQEGIILDDSEEEEEEEGTKTDATPRTLKDILQMAREIRGQEVDKKISETSNEANNKVKPRIELPRRMKMIINQYIEIHEKEAGMSEKEEPIRQVFCKKMTEHLSQNRILPETTTEPNISSLNISNPLKIQVSYPKQVNRLAYAYKQLREYIESRYVGESEAIRHATESPSLSTIFPEYYRINKLYKTLKALDHEADALFQRVPHPPPELSAEAISYRDEMLSCIKKQHNRRNDQQKQVLDTSFILQTSRHSVLFQEKSETFKKLQIAWENDVMQDQNGQLKLYGTMLQQAVLSDASDLVLLLFSKIFGGDGRETIESIDMQEAMRIVRLVDSITLSKGKKIRSVIRPI